MRCASKGGDQLIIHMTFLASRAITMMPSPRFQYNIPSSPLNHLLQEQVKVLFLGCKLFVLDHWLEYFWIEDNFFPSLSKSMISSMILAALGIVLANAYRGSDSFAKVVRYGLSGMQTSDTNRYWMDRRSIDLVFARTTSLLSFLRHFVSLRRLSFSPYSVLPHLQILPKVKSDLCNRSQWYLDLEPLEPSCQWESHFAQLPEVFLSSRVAK